MPIQPNNNPYAPQNYGPPQGPTRADYERERAKFTSPYLATEELHAITDPTTNEPVLVDDLTYAALKADHPEFMQHRSAARLSDNDTITSRNSMGLEDSYNEAVDLRIRGTYRYSTKSWVDKMPFMSDLDKQIFVEDVTSEMLFDREVLDLTDNGFGSYFILGGSRSLGEGQDVPVTEIAAENLRRFNDIQAVWAKTTSNPDAIIAAHVSLRGSVTPLAQKAMEGDEEALVQMREDLAKASLEYRETDQRMIARIREAAELDTPFANRLQNEVLRADSLVVGDVAGNYDRQQTKRFADAQMVRRVREMIAYAPHTVLNAKGTDEERREAMAMLRLGAHLAGPDYVMQAFVGVSEENFNIAQAWSELDEPTSKMLTFLGITREGLLATGWDPQNTVVFTYQLQQEMNRAMGARERQAALDRDYDWEATKFFAGLGYDFYRGVMDDPVATSELLPGMITGMSLGAGLAAKGVGGGAAFLIEAGYGATEGAYLGGYTSYAAQQEQIDKGLITEVNAGQMVEDAMFIGAMSAGMEGFFGSLGYGLRKTWGAGAGGVGMLARHGVFGEERRQYVLARELQQDLSNDDMAGIRILGPNLTQTQQVLLSQGELSAVDAVKVGIEARVTDTDGYDVLGDIMSPSVLDAQGISQIEAANFMASVLGDLGPEETISAAAIGDLWTAYVAQRRELFGAPEAPTAPTFEPKRLPLNDTTRTKMAENGVDADEVMATAEAEIGARSFDVSSRDTEITVDDKEYGWDTRLRKDPSDAEIDTMLEHVPTERLEAIRDAGNVDSSTGNFVFVNGIRSWSPEGGYRRTLVDLTPEQLNSAIARRTPAEAPRVRRLREQLALGSKADADNHIVNPSATRAASADEIAEARELATNFDPAGDPSAASKFMKILKTALRISDAREQAQFRAWMQSDDVRAALGEEQLGKINKAFEALDEASAKAKAEDPRLGKAIRVMKFLQRTLDDSTIRVQEGMGFTSRELAQAIRAYVATAGRPAARAALLAKYGEGVIEDMIEKAFKNVEDVFTTTRDEPALAMTAFKDSAKYKGIKAYQAARTRMRASIRRALKMASDSDRQVALDKAAKRYEKDIAEIKSKHPDVGIQFENAQQVQRGMLERATDYRTASPNQRTKMIADGFTRMVDRVDPEAVSNAPVANDMKGMNRLFAGTSIGDRFGTFWSSIALWPQSQSKLFRSRVRVIRGLANFIGNRHIGTTRYGDVTARTVEGAANAAKRQAAPVILALRNLRSRMSREAYGRVQSAIMYLRMTGKMDLLRKAVKSGDADTLQKFEASLPTEIREAYGNNMAQFYEDIFNVDRLYTNYNRQVLEEARMNGLLRLNPDGSPMQKINPDRYVPNNLNPNLSRTKTTELVDLITTKAVEQAKEANAALNIDVLQSLGWIRPITERNVLDKNTGEVVGELRWEVTEDSPFAGITGKGAEADGEYVVKAAKKGRAFLAELMEETRNGAKGDKTGKPAKPAPTKTHDSPNFGTPEAPRPTSARQTAQARNGAYFVTGADPILADIQTRIAELRSRDLDTLSNKDLLATLEEYNNLLAQARQRQIELNREYQAQDDMIVVNGIPVLRASMTREQIIAAVKSDDDFAALSQGHAEMLGRLNTLVENGTISETHKRLLMTAFAPLNLNLTVGLTMHTASPLDSRLRQFNKLWADNMEDLIEGDGMDPGIAAREGYEDTRQDILDYGLPLLDDINVPGALGMATVDVIPADSFGARPMGSNVVIRENLAETQNRNAAAVVLHEVSHVAFYNASGAMQAMLQHMYKTFKSMPSKNNPVYRFMKANGYDDATIEYAMSSVHEFVAHMSEMILAPDAVKVQSREGMKLLERLRAVIMDLLDKLIFKRNDIQSVAMRAGFRHQDWLDLQDAITMLYAPVSRQHTLTRSLMPAWTKFTDLGELRLSYDPRVDDPVNYVIDPSLDGSDKAADAKFAGEAAEAAKARIADIEKRINELNEIQMGGQEFTPQQEQEFLALIGERSDLEDALKGTKKAKVKMEMDELTAGFDEGDFLMMDIYLFLSGGDVTDSRLRNLAENGFQAMEITTGGGTGQKVSFWDEETGNIVENLDEIEAKIAQLDPTDPDYSDRRSEIIATAVPSKPLAKEIQKARVQYKQAMKNAESKATTGQAGAEFSSLEQEAATFDAGMADKDMGDEAGLGEMEQTGLDAEDMAESKFATQGGASIGGKGLAEGAVTEAVVDINSAAGVSQTMDAMNKMIDAVLAMDDALDTDAAFNKGVRKGMSMLRMIEIAHEKGWPISNSVIKSLKTSAEKLKGDTAEQFVKDESLRAFQWTAMTPEQQAEAVEIGETLGLTKTDLKSPGSKIDAMVNSLKEKLAGKTVEDLEAAKKPVDVVEKISELTEGKPLADSPKEVIDASKQVQAEKIQDQTDKATDYRSPSEQLDDALEEKISQEPIVEYAVAATAAGQEGKIALNHPVAIKELMDKAEEAGSVQELNDFLEVFAPGDERNPIIATSAATIAWHSGSWDGTNAPNPGIHLGSFSQAWDITTKTVDADTDKIVRIGSKYNTDAFMNAVLIPEGARFIRAKDTGGHENVTDFIRAALGNNKAFHAAAKEAGIEDVNQWLVNLMEKLKGTKGAQSWQILGQVFKEELNIDGIVYRNTVEGFDSGGVISVEGVGATRTNSTFNDSIIITNPDWTTGNQLQRASALWEEWGGLDGLTAIHQRFRALVGYSIVEPRFEVTPEMEAELKRIEAHPLLAEETRDITSAVPIDEWFEDEQSSWLVGGVDEQDLTEGAKFVRNNISMLDLQDFRQEHGFSLVEGFDNPELWIDHMSKNIKADSGHGQSVELTIDAIANFYARFKTNDGAETFDTVGFMGQILSRVYNPEVERLFSEFDDRGLNFYMLNRDQELVSTKLSEFSAYLMDKMDTEDGSREYMKLLRLRGGVEHELIRLIRSGATEAARDAADKNTKKIKYLHEDVVSGRMSPRTALERAEAIPESELAFANDKIARQKIREEYEAFVASGESEEEFVAKRRMKSLEAQITNIKDSIKYMEKEVERLEARFALGQGGSYTQNALAGSKNRLDDLRYGLQSAEDELAALKFTNPRIAAGVTVETRLNELLTKLRDVDANILDTIVRTRETQRLVKDGGMDQDTADKIFYDLQFEKAELLQQRRDALDELSQMRKDSFDEITEDGFTPIDHNAWEFTAPDGSTKLVLRLSERPREDGDPGLVISFGVPQEKYTDYDIRTDAGNPRELLKQVFAKAMLEADRRGITLLAFNREGNLMAKELGLGSSNGARVYNQMLKRGLEGTGWHTTAVEPDGTGGTSWVIEKGDPPTADEIVDKEAFKDAAIESLDGEVSTIRNLHAQHVKGEDTGSLKLGSSLARKTISRIVDQPLLENKLRLLNDPEINKLVAELRDWRDAEIAKAEQAAMATEVDPDAAPGITFGDVRDAIANIDTKDADVPETAAVYISSNGPTTDAITIYHAGTWDGDPGTMGPFTHFGSRLEAASDRAAVVDDDGTMTTSTVTLKEGSNVVRVRDDGISHGLAAHYELVLRNMPADQQAKYKPILQKFHVLEQANDPRAADYAAPLNGMVRESGIDAFVYKNAFEDAGHDSFIVVNPEAVREGTGKAYETRDSDDVTGLAREGSNEIAAGLRIGSRSELNAHREEFGLELDEYGDTPLSIEQAYDWLDRMGEVYDGLYDDAPQDELGAVIVALERHGDEDDIETLSDLVDFFEKKGEYVSPAMAAEAYRERLEIQAMDDEKLYEVLADIETEASSPGAEPMDAKTRKRYERLRAEVERRDAVAEEPAMTERAAEAKAIFDSLSPELQDKYRVVVERFIYLDGQRNTYADDLVPQIDKMRAEASAPKVEEPKVEEAAADDIFTPSGDNKWTFVGPDGKTDMILQLDVVDGADGSKEMSIIFGRDYNGFIDTDEKVGGGNVRELLANVFTKAMQEADRQGIDTLVFTRDGNLFAKQLGLGSSNGARVYNMMLRKYLEGTGWHTASITPTKELSEAVATKWVIKRGEAPEGVTLADIEAFKQTAIQDFAWEADYIKNLHAALGKGEDVGDSVDRILADSTLEGKLRLLDDPELNQAVAELRASRSAETKVEEPTTDAGGGAGKPPEEPPTAKGPDEEPEPKPEPKKDPVKEKLEKSRDELVKEFVRGLNKAAGKKGMDGLLNVGTPKGALPDGAKLTNLNDRDLIKEYDDALEGNGAGYNAIRDRSAQYVNTNMTDTSDARRQGATGTDVDVLVGQMSGTIDAGLERRFSDADFEDEIGNQIAQVFADNMDFAGNIMANARNMGARIKIQGLLNEAFGRGMSMQKLFAEAEKALLELIQTDGKTGTVSGMKQSALVEEAQESMKQMKLMFLHALGVPVSQFDPTSGTGRAMNISKNLAYSKLGGSFSQMVALVEAPFAILRTGGMGPLQILRNMSNFLGAIVSAAGDFTATNIPGMGKLMSAMGIDTQGARWIARDLVTYMENFDGTSALARFGFTGDNGNLAAFSLADKARASTQRVRRSAAGDTVGDDAPWIGSTIEAGSAALAEWTGALSAMEQVTDIARSIGINIGRVSLSKYGGKLIELAKKIESLGQVDDKTMVGMARELGIPKNIAIRAGHAGLLANGGKSLEVLRDVGGVRFGSSDGAQIDLNDFNAKIQEVQQARRQQGFMNDSTEAEFAAHNASIEVVQEYLLQFGRQASPEAKGSMAIGRGDPVTQFLFSMLSYPMAAYQELVVNGIKTSSIASTAGVLALLAAFEFNARMIRAMFDGDEEERNQAEELYKRVLSGELTQREFLHVLANYGTMSPALGHFGGWVGDAMNIGVEAIAPPGPGDSNDFRKAFANKAFTSPVIGATAGTIGSLMGAGTELAKMAGGQEPQTMAKAKQRERRLAAGLATAVDNFTPFNSGFFQAASQLTTGYKVGELAGVAAVQGARGFNRNASGSTPPGMWGARSMRQYNQVNQYDNPSEAPDYFSRMSGLMQSAGAMPAQWKSSAEQQQEQQASAPAAPSGSPLPAASSPSEGLADSLNRSQ